jgi:hypothetical protein
MSGKYPCTGEKSDEDIPKLVHSQYLPHATKARFDDAFGIARTVPSKFRKDGCKEYSLQEDGKYRVKYIYDDNTDLVLIVLIQNGIGKVITLYFRPSNNKNKNRGRFFVDTKNFTRSRVSC